MDLLYEFRRWSLQATPALLACLAVAYFGYHAVQGGRGLMAYARSSQDVVRAEQVLKLTEAERERLERRVRLLHPEHLDPDMLDERAREALGVLHPDEAVMFLR
jgi:cell division protein FtsB